MAIKASDQITITDITDGYYIELSNDSYTFIGNDSGAEIGEKCSIDIIAYCGKKQCNIINVNSNNIILPDGVDAIVYNSGTSKVRIEFILTDILNCVKNISIPVLVDSIIITKQFSISVARKGDKGDPGKDGAPGLQGIQGPKGEQGIPGAKGDPGQNGVDGKTSYFHIKYSSVSNPTSSSQISEIPNIYIGTYVDFIESDSTDPTKYTWSQFKGSQGEKGNQGIPGTNGINGKTSYLHIAYATNATGTQGFSVSDSAGKTYIGQYTDFVQTDSTDPTKYSWSLIKGDPGQNGVDGSDAIMLSIISSNGTVFKNTSDFTLLTPHVYQSGSEKNITDTGAITDIGNIKWYKNNILLSSSKSIRVNASSTSMKDVYICKIEKDNKNIISVDITISMYRDTDNITRFYKLVPFNNPIPSKPTSIDPSDWTDTEPTYTSGNNDVLYIIDRYIYSDGTYQYTAISKSSSYEAAKEAYNKAKDTQDTVNNMKIGGTNFIRNSINLLLESESGTRKSSKAEIILEKLEPNTEYTLSFEIEAINFKGSNYGFETLLTNGIEKFVISKYINQNNMIGRVFTTFTTPEWINVDTYHDFYPSNDLYPSNDIIPLGGETIDTKGYFYVNKQTGGYVKLHKIKLEKGNKFSDWSPAPEDTEALLDEKENKEVVEKIRQNLQEQLTNAKQTIDSINGMIQNLVVDKNGQTLMKQTSTGWSFNMNSVTEAIEKIASDLANENSERTGDVSDLQGLIDSLLNKTAYINIGTDSQGNPTMILGKEGSDYKLVISNTTVNFMNGSKIPAYINGNIFYGQNVSIINQLKIGEKPGFIFQRRSNGNLGLIYTNN